MLQQMSICISFFSLSSLLELGFDLGTCGLWAHHASAAPSSLLELGFDLGTFGLWAHHASAAPL